jgi:hypothetical protein
VGEVSCEGGAGGAGIVEEGYGGEARGGESVGAEDEGVTMEDRRGKEHEWAEGWVIGWADGWRAGAGIDAVRAGSEFAEGV